MEAVLEEDPIPLTLSAIQNAECKAIAWQVSELGVRMNMCERLDFASKLITFYFLISRS